MNGQKNTQLVKHTVYFCSRGNRNEKKVNITEGIFPMPVLIVATYNEDGGVNAMNAAWGTMQERGNVVLNLTETHKKIHTNLKIAV